MSWGGLKLFFRLCLDAIKLKSEGCVRGSFSSVFYFWSGYFGYWVAIQDTARKGPAGLAPFRAYTQFVS